MDNIAGVIKFCIEKTIDLFKFIGGLIMKTKWFQNVKAFIQGWSRMTFYDTRLKFVIRKHVREQIQYRILVMDRECYEEGNCKICGCMTPGLQMADKACPKPCYPPMMNKEQWEKFKEENFIVLP